jgi:hypothetical protein
MKDRIAPIALIALVSVFPLACDQPGLTERQKEEKASEEARNAATEAQRQAQVAQAEAEKSVSAAQADFATTRENYLHRRRLDLIALDSKIADLEAKSKTAEGKAKGDIRTRVSTLHARRDAVAHHLQDLETATATTSDGAVASLDKEWDILKKAVDSVE